MRNKLEASESKTLPQSVENVILKHPTCFLKFVTGGAGLSTYARSDFFLHAKVIGIVGYTIWEIPWEFGISRCFDLTKIIHKIGVF